MTKIDNFIELIDNVRFFLGFGLIGISLYGLFDTGRQFERDFGSAYQNSVDSAYAQGIAAMTDLVGEEFHEDVLSRRLENMTYSANN